MSVCRTCLAESAEKDITELEVNDKTNSYRDVMLFCLDIEIPQKDYVSTKLCLKCYRNILSFYNFKSEAQKNDIYLRSLEAKIKNGNVISVFDIKTEEPVSENFVSITIESEKEFEEDIDIKVENVADFNSDDEFLSVIKSIKCESNLEDTKENEPVKRKYKKRGPKKKSSEPTERMCEECGKTVRNLKEHMYQHLPLEERKRLQCKVCEKTFATKSARSKHITTKHLGQKKKCPVCDKEVTSLWEHLKRHTPEEMRYVCPVCDKRFVTPSQLALHSIMHSSERPFQCDQCEKTFGAKLNMLLHRPCSRSCYDFPMLHFSDRPLQCDQCEKTFDGKLNMLLHRRQVHDKEKSHLCQICSKRFFKKYHLQVHLRSHTKEKPFECPACGKHFSSSTTLKNHKLTHEARAFPCSECDMAFKSPKYLRVHMISHTKIKNHPCRYCGIKFGRSDHKKRHERTAHERHLLSTASEH